MTDHGVSATSALCLRETLNRRQDRHSDTSRQIAESLLPGGPHVAKATHTRHTLPNLWTSSY